MDAWRRLPQPKPTLKSFGIEPKIARDEGISYEYKPSDSRIAELYNSSTVFVQTSFHEGFSLPIIEAMACGCPVITTDSHGNMDFCVPDVNCLLVSDSDPDELVAAFTKLTKDSDLRSRLSLAGLETARSYSWETLIPRYHEFFTQIGNSSRVAR